MATFKVGQRARIVIAYNQPELLGKECTVVSNLIEGRFYPSMERKSGYAIDVDGVGAISDVGLRLVALPEQLEPIQDQDDKSKYDGREVINWDECIFDRNGKYKIKETAGA